MEPTGYSREALQLAGKELDLVLLSDKADPPVCRIMDYGKYKFELEKTGSRTPRSGELRCAISENTIIRSYQSNAAFSRMSDG